MNNFENVPDWANPAYKRRRRLLYVLLGIGIAAISVGLYFLFTRLG
ncbi:MAG: hypothetical protein P8X92_04810 [Dehalococcoidia bacterium]|jgi:hypothetical protein